MDDTFEIGKTTCRNDVPRVGWASAFGAMMEARGVAMTAADFKGMALKLEGAEEGSHMGAVDFRVGGRIFATLAMVKQGYGNLMLTPEMQQAFCAEQPEMFLPVFGGWGRMGATHLRLAEATPEVMEDALRAAWKLRVEKNGKTKAPASPKKAAAGAVKKAAKKSVAKKAGNR